MRSDIVTSPKGLQLRAIAGTYVVLLAMNCDKAYCAGLLGFGIWRTDNTNGEVEWLRGLKRFDMPGSDAGADVSTRNHPLQKFHWGDYKAKPGRSYTYELHAFRGSPGALEDDDSVTVTVQCEQPGHVGQHGHAVHFNRSAAASQAFAQHFPDLPKGDVTDPAARTWLSRGLAEALISFIDETGPTQKLRLFVYEFEKPEFLQALRRAADRGVDLQILYDGLIDKDGKGPSIKSNPAIDEAGLRPLCRARVGKGLAISHNKFMVRCDAAGDARAVWTGSTNFTDAGIYGQSNVGHAIADPALAGQYLQWHQRVWEDAGTAGSGLSVANSRTEAMRLSPMPGEPRPRINMLLSPRSSIEAITACASLVSQAERMVCFTAPFAMHDDLEEALVAAPAQVFGLLNMDGVVGPALHQAPNTQLAAAAALTEKSTLTEWQGRLLAESMQHSGVFIHTKILLIDPLGDQPVVISGSANFSTNSSKNNDENQLFIAGDTAVADVYLGEFMRMFDHYQFRDHMRDVAKQKLTNPKAGFLDETDGWTERFFGGHREAARLAFF